ncbi:hypothetical protein EYF80_009464 [Liparis tanakae]|uniref:Uncharacterized protein n=1 Tax=Liparis tanakae TaxID=230148 RepID=A0A4Z2IR03_9TELE|nr:hypothetical protein EYF80_009464 [Liparis tanakae]
MADCSMASSRSRMLVKDGRLRGFGLQHSEGIREVAKAYLHTSLLLEKSESLMTSGAIQAYVPAALILVVWCHSLARPKSVIFRVLPPESSRSAGSRMRTEEEKQTKKFLI